LPADITGTLIYNPRTSEFQVHKGPVFANIVLADEVNRAPAKVQSALLEAMQERHVTIGETTHTLGDPFLVLATQNPIEHEGTYPLPDAQLDRFLLQVRVDYPSRDEELEVLRRGLEPPRSVPVPGVTAAALSTAKAAVREVRVDPKIHGYMLDLVRGTRTGTAVKEVGTVIRHGASPRAAIHLGLAARAHAFLNRRPYVIPEDVRAVAPDALSHRLVLNYDAEADNLSTRDVVGRLLAAIPVP
jgi:MoxR-like ATPase